MFVSLNSSKLLLIISLQEMIKSKGSLFDQKTPCDLITGKYEFSISEMRDNKLSFHSSQVKRGLKESREYL